MSWEAQKELCWRKNEGAGIEYKVVSGKAQMSKF